MVSAIAATTGMAVSEELLLGGPQGSDAPASPAVVVGVGAGGGGPGEAAAPVKATSGERPKPFWMCT